MVEHAEGLTIVNPNAVHHSLWKNEPTIVEGLRGACARVPRQVGKEFTIVAPRCSDREPVRAAVSHWVSAKFAKESVAVDGAICHAGKTAGEHDTDKSCTNHILLCDVGRTTLRSGAPQMTHDTKKRRDRRVHCRSIVRPGFHCTTPDRCALSP